MKLELFKPLFPHRINQQFGANLPCVEKRNDISLDKRKIVTGQSDLTCPVGYEKLYPLLGLPKGHNGLDLGATIQNIYSSCEGVVTEMSVEAARGLGIGITTEQKYEIGNGNIHHIHIRYWHLKEIKVKAGDRIKVGDLIGITNSTGYSSGNHLHFEIKPVEKNSKGEFYNVYQDNGYYGAIDSLSYISDHYAQEEYVITLKMRVIALLQSLVNILSKK